ncbi:hypothetical protein OEZ85_001437 [Tetradesmus obliquus]|uniref:Ribosomal protein L27 n=1 Tax=Tetradesmus obliquus TaxID=3088 RepID=A0ABY8UPB7_TETOB|nr:hypothetical protein OEZ85_001437 [Tetradesmus obliquus]
MFATSMRASAFTGASVSSCRPVCAPRSCLVIEAAHKKGAGSTKNGRDSESKRRGVKVFGGQPVKAGGIIFRQTGSTWHAGENVGCSKDYTTSHSHLFPANALPFLQTFLQWHAGENVGCGKDYTIFSKVDGIVIYSKKKDQPKISVFPFEHEKARAAVSATHTTAPKDGVPSRAERHKAKYTPRAQQRAQQAAAIAAVAAKVTP